MPKKYLDDIYLCGVCDNITAIEKLSGSLGVCEECIDKCPTIPCADCNCDTAVELLDDDIVCQACNLSLKDPEFIDYVRGGAR